jgi:hypothetical protein
MDGKIGTFLLGVIAAVVLFMLWRKEVQPHNFSFAFPEMYPPGPQPQPASGCDSCGAASSPAYQGQLASVGLDGQISPGTPPLNAATGGQGATSFYTNAGVTPDVSFTFTPVARSAFATGTPVQPPVPNVPGSPTTPATVTPTRATQQVPNYAETGFVNRFNIAGVPRTVLSTKQVN